MYYIPSIDKEVTFKPLTIGQFNNILNTHNNYSVAHLGFNLAFIQTIKQNCLQEITLTDFDKHAIFIQTCLKDFELTGQFNKEFKQPELLTFNNVVLNIPALSLEEEFCNFLIQQTTNFSDIYLLAEIAKYIQNIESTDIDWQITFDKKIKILQIQPIEILIETVKYIDNYKAIINNYYEETLGKGIKYALDSLVV